MERTGKAMRQKRPKDPGDEETRSVLLSPRRQKKTTSKK
jgi:hypothetical protein